MAEDFVANDAALAKGTAVATEEALALAQALGTDADSKEPLKEMQEERPNSSRTPSVSSRQSIHVAVPSNVRPGEKFFVVVDDMEYEVMAPEDCMPGEMIAMDIMSDLRYWEDAPAVIVYPDPDGGDRPGPNLNESKEYEASVAESVATDASIVQITVPDECKAGDTFFAAVNGLEYEILVPKGSKSGDVITLEVPSKHAVGKFAVPAPAADVPSILVRDAMASQGSSETDIFAEISVPENTYPGQTFVAVIDNMEFEVPVPDGYGPGDRMTLQVPSRGFMPRPLPSELREMRQELQEVRQELQAVRQVQMSQKRAEEATQHVSKSSGDSNFIEIFIPPDCYAGDVFVVEVDDVEFEMVVPEGCTPGEVIYMDVREGAGYPAKELSSKQKSSSRPASAVKKKILQELAKEQLAREAAAAAAAILEITIPDDCYPGDVFVIEVNGLDIELVVPNECQPGEVIYMDLLPEGRVTNSRPASGTTATDKSMLGQSSWSHFRLPSGTDHSCLPFQAMAEEPSEPEPSGTEPVPEPEAQEETQATGPAQPAPEAAAAAATPPAPAEGRTASGSIAETEEDLVEIVVPEDCAPGDKFVAVFEMELKVPEGCEGGDVLVAAMPHAIPEAELDTTGSTSALGKTLEAMGWTKEIENLKQEMENLKQERLKQLPEPEVQPSAKEENDIQSLKKEIHHLKEEHARLLAQSLHAANKQQMERVDVKEKMTKEMATLRREVRKLKQAIKEPPPSIMNLLGAQAAEIPVLDMHFKLDGELSSFDEADFTNSLAETLGVNKSLIQIRLSPGSVIVDASISVSDSSVLHRAEEVLRLEKDELSRRLGSTVLEPPRFVLMAQGPQLGKAAPFHSATLSARVVVLANETWKEKSLSNETPRSSGVDVVDVTIPDGIHAGDVFYAEVPDDLLFAAELSLSSLQVNGVEFKVVVPENCGPGKIIEMEVPSSLTQEGLGPVTSRSSSYEAQEPLSEIVEVVIPPGACAAGGFIATLHGKDYEISVPEGGQEGDTIEIDLAGLSQPSSRSSQASKIYEVVVPDELKAGDLFIAQLEGKEYEIPVPYSCRGGDIIEVDVSGLSEPPSSASQVPESPCVEERPDHTFGVVIPATLCAHDSFTIMVHGKEFEISVPEGKQGGDEIVVEFAGKLIPAADEDAEDISATPTEGSIAPGSEAAEGQIASEAAPFDSGRCNEEPASKPSAGIQPSALQEALREEHPDVEHASAPQVGGKEILERIQPEPKPEVREEDCGKVRDAAVENACMQAEEEAERHRLEYLERQSIDEAERLRREEEEREAARIAAEKAAEEAERQRIEDLKRQALEEAERAAREEAARENACMQAEEEAERQRLEYLKRLAIEEAERLRREEEEREAARIAAEKAAEEAERQRIEDLKRQALEEAERAAREEEARIKREEAEIKGKVVVSVTVVNDETEELMAKASLRLGCKVLELAQVCIREARLSVTPAIFTEPKPEPRMVRGKMEVRERFVLNSEDTLLEAGVENNAVLRAKISPAVITASKDRTARIWNAETGKCELILEGHTEAVCSACISPDCRYVATSSEDGSSRLWYVDSGRCARVLLDHKEAVYFATFSPDSKQVVTASEDATAKIWVVKFIAQGPTGVVAGFTGQKIPFWSAKAKTGVCALRPETGQLWLEIGLMSQFITLGKDRTLLGQKPVYLASFASDGTTFVTTSVCLGSVVIRLPRFATWCVCPSFWDRDAMSAGVALQGTRRFLRAFVSAAGVSPERCLENVAFTGIVELKFSSWNVDNLHTEERAAAAAAVLAYTSTRPRRQAVDGELVQRLRSARVVPVLVIEDPSKAAALAKAIYDGGFSVIEVAFRSGNAEEVLREMAAAEPRVHLGAGSVLTTDQAADALGLCAHGFRVGFFSCNASQPLSLKSVRVLLKTVKSLSTMSARAKGQGDLETIELCHASGATAQVYLWGATLTSYKTADGTERIFVSPGALFDGKKAIRGGVPVVFPQFGQPDKAMAQHGFARTSFWSVASIEDSPEASTVVLALADNEATRSVWNFPFNLEYVVSLSAVSLKMTLRIKNTGDVAFPFQALLHTYFRVPEVQKVAVRGLGGRTYLDKVKGGEKALEAADVELPSFTDRVYIGGKDIVSGNDAKDVTIGQRGGAAMYAVCNEGSISGKPMPIEIVVWNPYEEASPGDLPPPAFKDFVCVEPGLIGRTADDQNCPQKQKHAYHRRSSQCDPKAVSCGAKFIATPGLNSEVLGWCLQRKIPVIPGVATPSEVQEASRMGLSLLKFFPAEVNGGTEGLKAISAPFPHINFYPSGGVTEKNLQAYLSLKQVIAVGGSWMVPQDAISGGDPELLKTLALSTLQALRVPKGLAPQRRPALSQVARSVGQASDGKVATASIDHTARLWSIDTGDCLMTFSGHADQVMCVSFSPDGELLATASTDKTAKLWLQTGQCIVTCVGHSGPVYTAFFSPDGCNLLTSSHDRTVKIWDTTSGLLTATLSKFERSIHSAVYSPDGQLIATAIDDPEVSIWSAKTLERVKVLSGHDMKVFSVQFSHDGNLLLTASMDQSARITDVHTGQTKLVITGHDDWLRCAAFSPDSLKVVTASGDGMAKTWSAVTGRPLLSLAGHEDWLRMAAFSADGRCVVTASKDGSARVWRSDNGKCLRKLDGHKSWVRWAAFAPNRHHRSVLSSSIAGCCRV
ncbi:HET-E1 [Symbiodinium sp. CCMP2456]|nr:HET-E1 [Symbiodinium sp. CCMP2456]